MFSRLLANDQSENPGEMSVSRVINGLTRNGVKVVHQGNALVHVSGHACAGELLYVNNIVKPRTVMPVHGEPRPSRPSMPRVSPDRP